MSEKPTKLTEEQLEELKEVLETEDTDDLSKFDNEEAIEPYTEKVESIVDPLSGTVIPLEQQKSEEELELDRETAKLLDIELEDLYKIPESADDLPFDDDLIIKNASNWGIKETAIMDLLPVLKRYRKEKSNEKINWYNELPDLIKETINKQCLEVNNTSMQAKKIFAEELLGGLIRDAGIDRITIDLSKVMSEKLNISPIVSMTLDLQRTTQEAEMNKRIEAMQAKENKTEEEVKALEALIAIKDQFVEACTLKSFTEALPIKVKKWDVEDFSKRCDDFCYKYSKDTPYIIPNISICVPILSKIFGSDYTVEQLKRFVVSFIKYTQNFKANDQADTTFVTYFLGNINKLRYVDINDKGQKEFYKAFIRTLDKAIRKENFLEEREYVFPGDDLEESENE